VSAGSDTVSTYYVVESNKPFARAAEDLVAAVGRHQFGVLHVHDLGVTLRSKGIAFDNECKVLEVCQPRQAAKVLATDMRLNMALPCRVSVWTEDGATRIGMIEPEQMLAGLSGDPALSEVAKEVATTLRQAIDEAR
jgi:uncharacterized protein (DUF302 family)